MTKTMGTASNQDFALSGVDSVYSTFSLTTKPLFMARARTRDIYRCRFMLDFAARESRCFSSFDVRRTVTGLAGSGAEGMAHSEEGKNTPEILSFKTFAIAQVIAK